MNEYRVTITWDDHTSDTLWVSAESEAHAAFKVGQLFQKHIEGSNIVSVHACIETN